MWIHRWPYRRCQCYGCIIWPVRPVCAVPCVSVYCVKRGALDHWLAPWWWFPCKPKHVGAAFLILICFNKLYMCISWTRKGMISLMHGVTMKMKYTYPFNFTGLEVTWAFSTHTVQILNFVSYVSHVRGTRKEGISKRLLHSPFSHYRHGCEYHVHNRNSGKFSFSCL